MFSRMSRTSIARCRVTAAFTNDEWQTIIELAAIATKPVARSFHKFTTAEELQQVCYEAALEHADKMKSFLDREDEGNIKQGERFAIRLMRKHANIYARKEKAHRLGYEVEDEYFYQVQLIESLLPIAVSGDYDMASQVLDPAELGGKRKKSLPNEGNNILALVADIQLALDSLEDREEDIVVAKVVNGETSESIAERWGVSRQRVDALNRRGIEKMAEYLGGGDPRH